MRKRFVSQPKIIIDTRKATRLISKDFSAEKHSNRPSTAGLQGNSFNNWIAKNNTIQNISSPKLNSPFNTNAKTMKPSIIEMLIAKHKTSNSKIKSSEFLKKTVTTRPSTVTTVTSPQLGAETPVRTPDHIKIVDDKFVRETPKVTLHLGKSCSYEVLDNFVLGNEIGKGAYATVRSAQNKENNSKVAIKIYDKFKLLTPSRKKNAEREIKILTKLNHPNIIKLYKTVENQKSLNLILEYVSGCSLMSYVKKRHNKKLDESEARRIFKQIIQGLEYCHNLNITHRDIKLENILIDPHHCVKIIDFGFSTCFSNDKKIRLFCGTPSYMSPEIVTKQESFGPPSDIWAAGVVLYVLLTGTFPFRASHSKELYTKIQRGAYFMPSNISQEAASVISAMLTVDPLKRPTAKLVLEYSWFKERPTKTFSMAERPREVPQVHVNLNNTFDHGKQVANEA